MALTIADLEKVQAQFPDYRMELVGGEIVTPDSTLEGLNVRWDAVSAPDGACKSRRFELL